MITTPQSSTALSRSRPRWVFPPSSPIREPRSSRPSVFQRGHRQVLYQHRQPCGRYHLEDIANDVDVLHSTAFDPLGLDVDLTLESVEATKSAPDRKSIFTIRAPSICFSRRHGPEIMRSFKEYSHVLNEEEQTINLRSLIDFNFDEKRRHPD